jgi:hypothetical protein
VKRFTCGTLRLRHPGPTRDRSPRTRLDRLPADCCGFPCRTRVSVPRRLSSRAARRPGAGLVHAAGRSLAAGVQGGARRHGHAGQLHPPRPGHRDHPAAGPPLRSGRGHLLLRHHGAAQGRRRRPGHRPRRRPGDRAPAAWARGPGAAATAGADRRAVRDRGDAAAGGRAGLDAADRLRRRPLHAGQLPGRGRPEQGLRPHQVADGLRAGPVAPAVQPAGRHLRRLPRGPGARRRVRGAAVRLLGGQPELGRLRPLRPALLWTGAATDRGAGRAAHPLRRRHLGAAGPDGRRRGRRGGRRLAAAAGRGQPADRTRVRGAGHLDPALLGAPWPVLSERVREVVRSGASAPGHVFNLGHGVPPTADPQVLGRIVELVQTEGPGLRVEARESPDAQEPSRR